MATIMVVDDDDLIIESTRLALEKNGYKVITAFSGEEALDMLKTQRPDLILLDIMMPGIDGWEVCRNIKKDEKTKDIPVAMFTVRSSEDSVDKSLNYAHADAQIDKPFKLEELFKVVKGLLKE
ncbi:MAG: PleD family two-component system response regulator [Candidatus Hydrothermarchaeales archaeon]